MALAISLPGEGINRENRGHDYLTIQRVSRRLNIGVSTLAEFQKALENIEEEQTENVSLGGYPLTPRFILSDGHCSLALSKETRRRKFYSYWELNQAFQIN